MQRRVTESACGRGVTSWNDRYYIERTETEQEIKEQKESELRWRHLATTTKSESKGGLARTSAAQPAPWLAADERRGPTVAQLRIRQAVGKVVLWREGWAGGAAAAAVVVGDSEREGGPRVFR